MLVTNPNISKFPVYYNQGPLFVIHNKVVRIQSLEADGVCLLKSVIIFFQKSADAELGIADQPTVCEYLPFTVYPTTTCTRQLHELYTGAPL